MCMKQRLQGSEDFHVTIEKDESGSIRTTCSCPKLASFQKDCQHIAAVLLLIYEQQRQRHLPNHPSEHHTNSSTQVLTEGLMTLFNESLYDQVVINFILKKEKCLM